MSIVTIASLTWKPHPAGIGGEVSRITFPNGYGASVLRGGPFYTSGGTYEIGVLDKKGHLTYETPVTDDVLGYLDEDQANAALAQIAALPNDTGAA